MELMVSIIPVADLDHLGRITPHEALSPFDVALCRAHRCQAHVLALLDGLVVARCSLWWTDTPDLPGQRSGVVGHFAALNTGGAAELLEAACHELAAHGCTLAIGPMDGNTWRRYRCLTERGAEPPFFLEPDNPDDWPKWFEHAGFSPLAAYFSAVAEDLSLEDPRIPRAAGRLEKQGVRIRPFSEPHFLDDLRRIYAVARMSFQSNFLYTPIEEPEFLAQYEPVRAHIRSELVMLAEQDQHPIGFVFAIPDLLQARRGPVDTVVLKTVAVLPGRAHAGLGSVLVARCHQAARARGFRRVIHALMHQDNSSLNISGHYAKPFRRYTLHSHPLLSP